MNDINFELNIIDLNLEQLHCNVSDKFKEACFETIKECLELIRLKLGVNDGK